MLFLFLIVCGVIAIIVVKVLTHIKSQHNFRQWQFNIFCLLSMNFQVVNPNNKDIRDIPGLAPPAPARRLLSLQAPEHFWVDSSFLAGKKSSPSRFDDSDSCGWLERVGRLLLSSDCGCWLVFFFFFFGFFSFWYILARDVHIGLWFLSVNHIQAIFFFLI